MERTLRFRIEAEDWKSLIDRFRSDLESAVRDVKIEEQRVAEAREEPEGMGGIFGGRGGLLGGIERWLGEKSPLILSIFAIMSIAGQIINILKDLAMRGARFSGHFQAAMQLFDYAIGMLFKPIADAVGMVVVPVLMLLLKYVILPFNQNVLKWFREPLEKKLSDAIVTAVSAVPGMSSLDVVMKLFGIKPSEFKENLSSTIADMFKKIKDRWSEIWDGVDFIELWTSLKSKWDNWVLDIKLSDLWDMLSEKWQGFVDYVNNAIKTFKDSFGNIVSTITGAVVELFMKIIKSIDERIRAIPVVGGIYGAMRGGIGETFGNIETQLRDLGEKLDTLLGGAEERGGYEVGETFWRRKGHLLMQTGGIIPKTGLYVMHKGEKVIPSWKNVEGGHTFNINVNVNVDRVESDVDIGRLKDEIAERIVDEIMRRGAM